MELQLLTIVRIIGSILFVILPGAWISFFLPFKGESYWARLLLAVVLTPLVVVIEFYLLRWIGVPFGWTTLLMIILNLPALVPIIKQRPSLALPDRIVLIAAGIVFVIIILCILPFLLDPQKRLYTWESWMQADIIYSLANGNLFLQDPDMAGVTLSYPWIGQVYQAAFSYILNTPPVTNYIWLNLVWLVAMFGFAAKMVDELGGNALSKITVAIWLSFGANFVGNIAQKLMPKELSDTYHVLRYLEGDNRYTPWLDKIIAFSQMYFGMGLFIAIAYIAIKKWPEDSKWSYLLLTGLLLTSLGLVYSILLPPALVLVGVKVLLQLIERLKNHQALFTKEFFGWVAVIFVSGLVTFAQIQFLTSDRGSQTLIHWNDLHFIKYESLITFVVMSPLLLGLALTVWKLWKSNRDALLILVAGGLVSCLLYVLFDIPWWRNEYKFVFTAVICLAPFPALALEPYLNDMRKLTLPFITLLTITLALPFAYKVYVQGYYYYTRPGPLADVSDFNIRLEGEQPLAAVTDVIREKTPVNSMVVLDNTEVHYPTLTQRDLYIAPEEKDPKPGILVTNDELLILIKGYSKQTIDERRAVVKDLYESDDPERMSRSLQQILQMNRPLVLVTETPKDEDLIEWLHKETPGELLYEEGNFKLWLMSPSSVR